jgi:hypothetical protein
MTSATHEVEEVKHLYTKTEHAALLASFVMVHGEWNAARAIKEANAELLAHVIGISIERAPKEEASRLLMEAEPQKINKINTQTRVELAACEAQRVALNEEVRSWRVEVLARGHREAPPTPTSMMH